MHVCIAIPAEGDQVSTLERKPLIFAVNLFAVTAALMAFLIIVEVTYTLCYYTRHYKTETANTASNAGQVYTKKEVLSDNHLETARRRIKEEIPVKISRREMLDPTTDSSTQSRAYTYKNSYNVTTTAKKMAKKPGPCRRRKLPFGCVTNNPFGGHSVTVEALPLQFADAQPQACRDKLCSNHLTSTDKMKNNTCWKSAKRRNMLPSHEAFHCHFMNGTGRAPVGLVSFPGSGNTWARGLLEQVTGYCTGSIYCDPGLLEKGFAGENVQSGAALVVKSHMPKASWINDSSEGKYGEFGAIIFIIRNPFDALEAEMNRMVHSKLQGHPYSWKSHVMTAGDEWFGKSLACSL